jgi:hypothetical protein
MPFYKQQPKKDPQLSFVAAVKECGDCWRIAMPSAVGRSDALGPGFREALKMEWCERGVIPRIETCAELYE